jgi:hypothetical protein
MSLPPGPGNVPIGGPLPPPKPLADSLLDNLECHESLGGLLTHYERKAAQPGASETSPRPLEPEPQRQVAQVELKGRDDPAPKLGYVNLTAFPYSDDKYFVETIHANRRGLVFVCRLAGRFPRGNDSHASGLGKDRDAVPDQCG